MILSYASIAMKHGVLVLFFVFFLAINGSQYAFSESITIEQGATVTAGPGTVVIIDSSGSTNELNNQGTLNVQGDGKIVIQGKGNFLNDVSAVTNLESDGVIEIGNPGATIVTLTNHGTINGPGQINLFGNVIEIVNTGLITAIINQFTNGDDNGDVQVIGGKLIPIETTSLLLTGAQTNAAWLIPLVIASIGFGIVIARRI